VTLYEALFKIKHDCPFGNISARFPSVKIFIWYSPDHDVIEIVAQNPKDYQPVIEQFAKLVKIIEKHSEGDQIHLVTTRRRWGVEDSVTGNIEAFNLLQIPPEVYENGWEHYHVIAFNHNDFQGFMQSIQEKGFKIEILGKSTFSGFLADSLAVNADAVFSSLTEKQREALFISYDRGYYKIPRKASLTTIAKNRRIPRTTFEEHLRKGENKILTALMPYMRIFETRRKEKNPLE
jgi:predicted DNA binding protein